MLTEEPPSELSLGDALELAVQLHRGGQLEAAETLYQRILDIEPSQPDALAFLGMISMHRGRTATAIELMQKAIALEPESADRYNNLGNVFLAAERVDDALEAYRKAIELAPAQADAWSNLGVILGAQRKFDDAARAFERAIEINPGHVEAYNNYGNFFARRGDARAAIRCYSKSLTLRPRDPEAMQFIALAHTALGEIDQATAIYREFLERNPGHPAFTHLLAACSGEGVPKRAADDYIETTFDSFSRSFDARLAKLEYRAPELVADALRRAVPDARRSLDALDVGCGTGLCGPLIACYVSRLHGVDLSSGMLEKARGRGIYDELVKAELTQYLQTQRESYDLVISADTLVYFGVLDEVLPAAAGALRPGGLLVFTVEKADEAEAPAGHRLNPHGRYSHTRSYVERTLRGAGFSEIAIENAILRREVAEPVHGVVVTARKAH